MGMLFSDEIRKNIECLFVAGEPLSRKSWVRLPGPSGKRFWLY